MAAEDEHQLPRRTFLGLGIGAVAARVLPAFPAGAAEAALAAAPAAPVVTAASFAETIDKSYEVFKTFSPGVGRHRAVLEISESPIAAFTGSELEQTVSNRFDAALAKVMESARQFRALKQQITSESDTSHNAKVVHALKTIVEKKQEFLRAQLKEIFSLCPVDDPRFRPVEDDDPRFTPVDPKKLTEEELYAYDAASFRDAKDHFARYTDFSVDELTEEIDECLRQARNLNIVPEGFEQALSNNAAGFLQEKIAPIAESADIPPDIANALTQDFPVFCDYHLGHSELYEFFYDEKLFERLANFMGTLTSDVAQSFMADDPAIIRTPENLEFAARRFPQLIRMRYLDAFKRAFPDVPEDKIPLPEIYPQTIQALEAKRAEMQPSSSKRRVFDALQAGARRIITQHLFRTTLSPPPPRNQPCGFVT